MLKEKMDNKTEALKMALEALEDVDGIDTETECVTIDVGEVITAIREVLKQPEQEPVAWRYNGKLHEFDPSDWATGPVTPLYTSPPQAKPLVGLTDKEIEVCLHHVDEDGIGLFAFARDIEAKLKEKNT